MVFVFLLCFLFSPCLLFAEECVPREGVEICNGADDNCDGLTDEGFDKDGDGYTTCGGDCDDRRPDLHADAVERCDGIDNDCNGLIDDGFQIGSRCTVGIGECERQGMRRCSKDGGTSECDVVAGIPSAERCDGKDNNCNGEIDEGLGGINCGIGACRRMIPACKDGAQNICGPDLPPGPEICGNKIDDDCNGNVDTDAQGIGEPCDNGDVGLCHRTGKMVCDVATGNVVCTAAEIDPSPEICDGKDNDCDGENDNGVVEKRSCGLGACAGGQQERMCEDGVFGNWSACSGDSLKKSERCDGVDNDCDGIADNQVNEEEACGLGVCAGGTRGRSCRAGRWQEWTVCSTASHVRPEVCDGLDNNCNGEIDEGVTNICGGCALISSSPGESCELSELDGICRRGVWRCVSDGTITCSQMESPRTEVCDGLDDDCNGTVDDVVGIADFCSRFGTPDLTTPRELTTHNALVVNVFDQTKTRAFLLPWKEVTAEALAFPHDPDQATLFVSGTRGEGSEIVFISLKQVGEGGAIVPHRCVIEGGGVIRQLSVGDDGEILAVTEEGSFRISNAWLGFLRNDTAGVDCRLEAIAMPAPSRVVNGRDGRGKIPSPKTLLMSKAGGVEAEVLPRQGDIAVFIPLRQGGEFEFLELPERLVASARADDLAPGGILSFARPYGLLPISLKPYGGDDLFAVFEIHKGAEVIGAMGFFYWNQNEWPKGRITDAQFDGSRGSARLAFADLAGDVLTYRVTIKAQHGGLLNKWIDGIADGILTFSPKGDASSVGIWPIEITVDVSDPGGATATDSVTINR